MKELRFKTKEESITFLKEKKLTDEEILDLVEFFLKEQEIFALKQGRKLIGCLNNIDVDLDKLSLEYKIEDK